MKEKTKKSVVEQAADALRLWSNAWNEFDKTGKNKPETFEEVIKPFIEMEKEQKIKFAEHCLDKALDLDIRTAFANVEQYYNETFKSE